MVDHSPRLAWVIAWSDKVDKFAPKPTLNMHRNVVANRGKARDVDRVGGGEWKQRKKKSKIEKKRRLGRVGKRKVHAGLHPA